MCRRFHFEVLKHPIAGVFNIGMPVTLTVLMLTAIFWLPKIGESSEAAEGFGPAVPLFLLLAAVTALMYAFVRPANSGSQT